MRAFVLIKRLGAEGAAFRSTGLALQRFLAQAGPKCGVKCIVPVMGEPDFIAVVDADTLGGIGAGIHQISSAVEHHATTESFIVLPTPHHDAFGLHLRGEERAPFVRGDNDYVFIGIRARADRLTEVVHLIAELDDCVTVDTVSGRFDIFAAFRRPADRDIDSLAHELLLRVNRKCEKFIVDTVTYWPLKWRYPDEL